MHRPLCCPQVETMMWSVGSSFAAVINEIEVGSQMAVASEELRWSR